MGINSKTKYRSLDAIKASIRAGRKYAMESGEIKDPNEVPVSAVDKDAKNVSAPEGAENVNNLKEAVPAANTELKQNLTADQSDVKAEQKPEEEKKEKDVSVAAAEADSETVKQAFAGAKNALQSLISKVKTASPVASNVNVAADIDLSERTLSKIASLMLATERGRALALETLEKNKAENMKLASLNELLHANEVFKKNQMLKQAAEEQETQRLVSAHKQCLAGIEKELASYNITDKSLLNAVKYAYAQGVDDAAAMAAQGQLPEEAATTAQAEQNDITAVLGELVQAGIVTPEGAQALSEIVAQIAQQDGNPQLSPDEAVQALQQAVEAGIITPEVAQQIVGGGAAAAAPAAAPAAVAADAQGAAAPAPMDAASTPEEVAKQASVILDATCQLKKQASEEGAVDSPDATIDDIDVVIDQLTDDGSISEDEADALKDYIASEIIDLAQNPEGGDVAEAPVAEEAAAAADGGDEEINVDELVDALAKAGVTPEELEAAIKEDVGEEAAAAEAPVDEEAAPSA